MIDLHHPETSNKHFENNLCTLRRRRSSSLSTTQGFLGTSSIDWFSPKLHTDQWKSAGIGWLWCHREKFPVFAAWLHPSPASVLGVEACLLPPLGDPETGSPLDLSLDYRDFSQDLLLYAHLCFAQGRTIQFIISWAKKCIWGNLLLHITFWARLILKETQMLSSKKSLPNRHSLQTSPTEMCFPVFIN